MPTNAFEYLKKYLMPQLKILLVGMLATILFAAIDAGATYMLSPVIDKGFIQRDQGFIKGLPLLVLAAFVLRAVTNFLSTYCMNYAATSVIMSIRQDMYAKMLELPALVYDQVPAARLLSKLLFDVEQVAQNSLRAITDFLQSLFFVIGLIAVMFYMSWRLSLIFFAMAPFMIVLVRYTNKRIRFYSQTVQRSMGRVTEIAEESMQGYQEIRIYQADSFVKKIFNTAVKHNRQQEIKVVIAKCVSTSGVQAIAACGISVFIFLAITPYFSLSLSAGRFAALLTAMLALLKPLKNLTKVNGNLQRGFAGAQSVIEFMQMAPEKDAGHLELEMLGPIEFKDVSFRYQDGKPLVLHNINLRIHPGQTIALVGRSGAGKTTMTQLLARFYDPTAGSITIAGIDIKQLRLAALRKQIAVVSQSVNLFNGTVAENIALGCTKEVSMAEIENAAKLAHALEFINALPQGFATPIGDNGVLLSGGQRQRLAIARALLKDAPLLLLDEATSALDSESELYIQQALMRVMHDRTTIVIAHRLSTIKKADRIVVMEEGRIIEQGSHESLLAKQGAYAKLHALQFQGSATPWETATASTN